MGTISVGQNPVFVRTCQSCGHEQVARDPKTYADDSWRDLMCKKCGSVDFDYGKFR